MANPANTFQVTVDKIGTFTCALRNLRDEMRVHAEYGRLTEGIAGPTMFLDQVATWTAVLKVVVVKAPDGWDIDEMDPLDPETTATLSKVHGAYCLREAEFRSKRKTDAQAAGAGPV